MDCQFRSAAFGGFNRQDVMEYLERTAREHGGAVRALQEQLDAARQESAGLTARLEQAEARARELESALEQESAGRTAAEEQARSLLQEREERAARLAQEQEELRRQLARTRSERDGLRRQVERLEPDALAYAAVKERSAGVELDAHRRAQGIMDEADRQARALRQQTDQWLSRVGREYGGLRTQMDAAMAAAAGELDKVRRLLEGVSQTLAQQDGALDALSKAYTENSQPRVPAPMPLDETE